MKLKTFSHEIDETEEFPRDTVEKMAKQDLLEFLFLRNMADRDVILNLCYLC